MPDGTHPSTAVAASPTPAPGLTPEARGRMWSDLFTSELTARSASHHVTRRAENYLACGLPLDEVLDALKLTPDEWANRCAATRQWEADNRAAARSLEATR